MKLSVVVVMLSLSSSCVIGNQPSSKPVVAENKMFTVHNYPFLDM